MKAGVGCERNNQTLKMTESLGSKLYARQLAAGARRANRADRNIDANEEQLKDGGEGCQTCVEAACPGINAGVKQVPGSQYSLSLYVHRTTTRGTTKVVKLQLMVVPCVSMLKKLFRSLLETAFPDQLPQYLTSGEYYLFTPELEFVSLPGDSVRTQFRLVASVNGWDTVIAVRELGRDADPERRMLVTMAEFDSQPVSLGDGNDMVVSLAAYPSVSVRKSFLDAAIKELEVTHSAIQTMDFDPQQDAMVVE